MNLRSICYTTNYCNGFFSFLHHMSNVLERQHYNSHLNSVLYISASLFNIECSLLHVDESVQTRCGKVHTLSYFLTWEVLITLLSFRKSVTGNVSFLIRQSTITGFKVTPRIFSAWDLVTNDNYVTRMNPSPSSCCCCSSNPLFVNTSYVGSEINFLSSCNFFAS